MARRINIGGKKSPMALNIATIFAKETADGESGTIQKEPSVALGWASQKIPIPISIIADITLDQIPIFIFLELFIFLLKK